MLARGDDHVFIDCGPVGLAGRGGHGHNDCLSFEATLDGTKLVTDCGSYVYTASTAWRNRFRATAAHNTPQIDGDEQNRIPESLWLLDDDAQPQPLLVEELRFRGAHTGYLRLADPVRPVRTIALEPDLHALLVHDELEARAPHDVEIPFHLAEGIEPVEPGPRRRSPLGDSSCAGGAPTVALRRRGCLDVPVVRRKATDQPRRLPPYRARRSAHGRDRAARRSPKTSLWAWATDEVS